MGKKNVGLRRETADRLLDELVERAENTPERFMEQPDLIVVFGSYLDDVEKMGDIDVGVGLRRNPDVDFMEYITEARERGEVILGIGAQIAYPTNEVLKYLRDGSVSFSFHEVEEIAARMMPNVVLWREEPGDEKLP